MSVIFAIIINQSYYCDAGNNSTRRLTRARSMEPLSPRQVNYCYNIKTLDDNCLVLLVIVILLIVIEITRLSKIIWVEAVFQKGLAYCDELFGRYVFDSPCRETHR